MTETEFIDAVTGWHDFHSAVAGVAATLLGLLFVGLAMNPGVMQDDGPKGMGTWAGLTFHNFLIMLAISLVVLIPEQSAEGIAIPIGLMSAHGVYRVARDIHQEGLRIPPVLLMRGGERVTEVWRILLANVRTPGPGGMRTQRNGAMTPRRAA